MRWKCFSGRNQKAMRDFTAQFLRHLPSITPPLDCPEDARKMCCPIPAKRLKAFDANTSAGEKKLRIWR